MTSGIKAIKALQASIEPERTAEMRDIVEFMQRRTGLNEGEIWLLLMELRDALVFFARHGQATKVPGIGTFTPTLRADGDFHITFRPAVELKRALNSGDFYGRIKNKPNRGKSAAELVALWNELHPDDLVEG
ncbi:MAG: hypothetical protein ABIG63_11550 [Chloroflexota bacterium]